MSWPVFPLQVPLAGCTAYLFALGVTPWIRRLALASGCVSRPEQDRWGRRFVPRLGGLPIAIGFLAAAGWASRQDPRMTGLLLGGTLITATGLVDDFHRMHPNAKLIAQILTGCIVVLFGVQVDLPSSWLAIPLTIGWLVLVMNAFNLMDNMDGLSAGIGAIAGAFCALHALYAGQTLIATVSLGLTGATLGFLQYNLPPAKIFMGDTGSQVLGLALGALALMETWHQPARLLGILSLPTLLLAVPIFDTLFVTFQRILHGRHPFQGGTDHLSHRLGFLGLTPRQVVFLLYSLTIAFGALSFIPITNEPITILGIWLLAMGALVILGTYLAKVRVYTLPEAAALPEAKITFVDTMLMHKRRIIEMAVDFAFICASYVMAHALRFEANLSPDLEVLLLKSLPWVIAIKLGCFYLCGLYRGIWRYISLSDLANILRAVVLGSILSAVAMLYLWRFEGYSRAVFIIDGTLLFLTVSGARLVEPMLNEWIRASSPATTPVLIFGAGDTGEFLLQQIKMNAAGRRVVGFLDDDRSKMGNQIHGVPILGTRRDLGRIVQKNGIREVYLAMRHPPEELLQKIRGYCEENGIAWRMGAGLMPQDRSTANDG